jgi:hypothetical protein
MLPFNSTTKIPKMLFWICILQSSVVSAHELQNFNQLLVAPISGVFGSHNSLDATAHFYKSLFERGWPLLVCLDSDDACVYLQVLHFILLDLYMTT